MIGRIVRRFHPWEGTARRAGGDQRALQGAALLVRERAGFVPGELPLPHASDLAQNEDYQFEDLSHQQLQYAQEAEDGKRPYTYFVDP